MGAARGACQPVNGDGPALAAEPVLVVALSSAGPGRLLLSTYRPVRRLPGGDDDAGKAAAETARLPREGKAGKERGSLGPRSAPQCRLDRVWCFHR